MRFTPGNHGLLLTFASQMPNKFENKTQWRSNEIILKMKSNKQCIELHARDLDLSILCSWDSHREPLHNIELKSWPKFLLTTKSFLHRNMAPDCDTFALKSLSGQFRLRLGWSQNTQSTHSFFKSHDGNYKKDSLALSFFTFHEFCKAQCCHQEFNHL